MGIGKIKFIDLKGVNITPDSTNNVAGIYDALEGAIGEIICVANLTVDGVEKGTAVVSPKTFVDGGDTYLELQMAGFRILVAPDDKVFCFELSSVNLPVVPEDNGNYELKLTVSSGVAELTWVEI